MENCEWEGRHRYNFNLLIYYRVRQCDIVFISSSITNNCSDEWQKGKITSVNRFNNAKYYLLIVDGIDPPVRGCPLHHNRLIHIFLKQKHFKDLWKPFFMMLNQSLYSPRNADTYKSRSELGLDSVQHLHWKTGWPSIVRSPVDVSKPY